MSNEFFSKRLREARLHAGLSQAALGIAAGIDEFSASPRINQYEKGKHLPDLLTVSRIAAVLGVPPPYFFTEDDALAELIRCWGNMDEASRQEFLGQARQRGGSAAPEKKHGRQRRP